MPRRTVVDPRFGVRLRELLNQRQISFRALAARTYYSKSYLHDVASGKKPPTVDLVRRIDEAVELARRVAVSDVGEETLTRLESAVDELAMAYTAAAPDLLLDRVRRHLGYVNRIIDARKTLRQQRRLLIAAGWLSLLAATTHIDLRQSAAARARLTTAAELAQHAEHPEIEAWRLETQAWEVLNHGDYRRVVDLSRHAQAAAPRGSSVYIQAIAQEGRAWARMHRHAETRDALDRLASLTSSLAVPDHPEHHYRYDPDKALSYTATTLAWAGDPAAEEYARELIQQLERPETEVARPRRVALARLDLGLALLATGSPDEAATEAIAAIASGRVVPSNWWRATEVLTAVERRGVREANELREVYEAHRPVS